jgi:hypothetical protein
MYTGFVTTLKNVRKHPNADRMQLADCFGNTVCVGLDASEGEVVLYFPVDGQLSTEYCAQNDLVRRKDENGNNCGGYLDPDKRNIRALKLRGEKSDGLTMPLESLAYTGVDIATLKIGDTITVVNGHEICQKYVPKTKNRVHTGGGNKVRKHKAPIAPLFQEHADTEQLAYNLNAFKTGDEVEITLKMHGTSQRTGYLPVLKGHKRTFWDKILRRPGTPIYDYGYVTGTRRVVLDTYNGGFYGSNEFREQHAKIFEGKLWKGETVYYEVVGFTHTGTPIMSSCNNKKISDKEFVKQYGEETVFSYGCHPNGWSNTSDGYNLGRCEPQSDIYIYRMTMTNEDGNVVEYTPDFMRYRCEQIGVKCVPVMWKGIIPENLRTEDFFCDSDGAFEDWVYATSAGDWVKNKAEQFYDGPDPIGKTHVREGVVVRILNRPKFAAYKHKNFSFKVLEGLIKDVADAPDMEEASGLEEELRET